MMAQVPEGNTAGLRWQHQSSAEIQVLQQAGGIITTWSGTVMFLAGKVGKITSLV